MRIHGHSIALGAALVLSVSLGAWAQDQPAAGAPPPGTPAQTQQAPDANANQNANQDAAQNAAAAQNDEMPPPPIDARQGPNPHRQAKILAEKLGLTPEQQADVELVLANRQQRMRQAHNDVMLGPQDRKALVREINRDSMRRINAVLTPGQRQEYKQFRQEQRAKRLERQQQMQAQPPANN